MGILSISEVMETVEKRREKVFEDFSHLLNSEIVKAVEEGQSSVDVKGHPSSTKMCVGKLFCTVEVPGGFSGLREFMDMIERETKRAGYQVCRRSAFKISVFW